MTKTGKLIAMYSPVGGVGITTIATQMAACLSKHGAVCIIDLNGELGMVAEYLGIDGSIKTLDDFARSKSDYEFVGVQDYFTVYEDTFSIISLVVDADKDQVMEELLLSLKSEFDYIIVDLPHHTLSPGLNETLRSSDHIFLVGEYDLPRCKRVIRFLQEPSFKRIAKKKRIFIIINKVKRLSLLLSFIPLCIIFSVIAWWISRDYSSINRIKDLDSLQLAAVVLLLTYTVYRFIQLFMSDIYRLFDFAKSSFKAPLKLTKDKVFYEIPLDIKAAHWANTQGKILPSSSLLGKSIELLTKRYVDRL